jgi:hypothetical protein
MSTLEEALLLVIVILAIYILWTKFLFGGSASAAEQFGACTASTNCDSYADRIFSDSDIVAQNPYRWPASGTAVTNQWAFSPGGKKPVNTTDDAEALPYPNASGMNQLTVPDQEFTTN